VNASAQTNRRTPAVRAAASAGAYLALFYLTIAVNLIPGAAQKLPKSAAFAPLMLVSVAAFMLVQLLLVRHTAGLQLKAAALAAGTAICLALWFLIPFSVRIMRPETAFFLLAPWRNLFMILAATFFGCLVSLAIREPGILLPGVLVAGMVDYWGVYYGTTLHVIQTAPKVVEKVSVKLPALGMFGPVATIGPGDFVFLGLFFSAMYRHNLKVSATFWVFLALLVPCMLVVIAFGISIPALVPMAVAMLLVNHDQMRLTKSEKFATLYILILLATALALLTYFGPFRRSQPTPKPPGHPSRSSEHLRGRDQPRPHSPGRTSPETPP